MSNVTVRAEAEKELLQEEILYLEHLDFLGFLNYGTLPSAVGTWEVCGISEMLYTYTVSSGIRSGNTSSHLTSELGISWVSRTK